MEVPSMPIATVLLTPQETADRLRISMKTVTNWLREGRLPGVKVGPFWRIREDRLERFIEHMEERT